MLKVNDAPKSIPRDSAPKKEGNGQKAQVASQKPVALPVDKVVLKQKEDSGVRKEDEYLVATYWG